MERDPDYLDGMDAFYPEESDDYWRVLDTAAHQEFEAEYLDWINTGGNQ